MFTRASNVEGIHNEWVPGVTPLNNEYSIMNSNVLPMQIGFPQPAPKIYEWVPGLSTPEGLSLVGATIVVSGASSVMVSNPEMFEKVFGALSSAVFYGTTMAIPAATIMLGSQFIGQTH